MLRLQDVSCRSLREGYLSDGATIHPRVATNSVAVNDWISIVNTRIGHREQAGHCGACLYSSQDANLLGSRTPFRAPGT
jgi:hypothetical protein